PPGQVLGPLEHTTRDRVVAGDLGEVHRDDELPGSHDRPGPDEGAADGGQAQREQREDPGRGGAVAERDREGTERPQRAPASSPREASLEPSAAAGLDVIFDQVPSLSGRPRTVSELPGGLTNRNFKIATENGTFVARVASGGSELLAIDRDHEHRNSVRAAAA